MPFVLAVATAANIGSVATITGNPQNMLIGSFSGLRYGQFAAHLAPVAVLGLFVDFAVLWTLYRRELATPPRRAAGVPQRRRIHRPLLLKSVLTAAATVLLFALGVDVSKVALGAAAVLLVTRRVRPEKIYREVDWTLLVLFIGLFVVVGGLEATGIEREWMAQLRSWRLDRPVPLALVAVLFSNIVSNVPAVMMLKPFVSKLNHAPQAWLTVAAASTLAGNLTPVASVANLIVLEQARRAGVRISFGSYVRVGLPVTVLSLLCALAVLMVAT